MSVNNSQVCCAAYQSSRYWSIQDSLTMICNRLHNAPFYTLHIATAWLHVISQNMSCAVGDFVLTFFRELWFNFERIRVAIYAPGCNCSRTRCGMSSLERFKIQLEWFEGTERKTKQLFVHKHNILSNLFIKTTLQYNKIWKQEICTIKAQKTN